MRNKSAYFHRAEEGKLSEEDIIMSRNRDKNKE